jgi:hypothetical protein
MRYNSLDWCFKVVDDIFYSILNDISFVNLDYVISNIIKKLDVFDNVDGIFEMVINHKLSEIKKLNMSKEELVMMLDYADDFLEIFNYAKYEVELGEALILVDDLVFKAVGVNNRLLEFPVSIKDIKNYSISYVVCSEKIIITLVFVLLKFYMIL